MCCEKALTYEEAKQLCMKAFDGGALYGRESMRYGVNARAYNWDHWLKKNECLFKPRPTVEDVLREFASDIADVLGGDDFRLDDSDELFAEYAAKLRLAGDGE